MELTVDRIAVGGKALGLDGNGRATFVAGAVPPERVAVRLTKRSKRFAEGEVVQVLSPSPDRVAPACPHAASEPRCGGCDWQFVSADGQRRLRVAMVEDAVRRIGKLDTSTIRIESGASLPVDAYRTGVRMLVGPGGRLGYRRRRSHEVVVPGSCGVAHPLVDELIGSIRAHAGTEVSIRVGDGTGDRMVVGDMDRSQIELPDGVVFARSDESGTAHIHDEVEGVPLRISSGAFFQSSTVGAALLVQTVREALEGVSTDSVLLDAYSGGGLFSATIGSGFADGAGSVVAVESNAIAVADALVNAPHATSVACRFEDWDPTPVDAAIADPSRSGLGADGVQNLVATGAKVVVLVSCDAGALGRDVGLLSAAGYRMDWVRVLDLFNQTSHVEVVTRLIRE